MVTIYIPQSYKKRVLEYLHNRAGEWVSISEAQRKIGHDLAGNDWSYVYIAYNTIRKHMLRLHKEGLIAMKREFINFQHRIYFKLS